MGAHYFYLGIQGTALTYLLTSVLACWIGGPIFIFMAGFVDFICLQQMSGAEFDSRFNHRTPKTLEFIFKTKPHALPPGNSSPRQEPPTAPDPKP